MLPLQPRPTVIEIPSASIDRGEHSIYPKRVYAPTAEPGPQADARPPSSYELTTSPFTSALFSSNQASQSSTLESQRQIETSPSAEPNPSSQDPSSGSRQIVVQKSQQSGPISGKGLASYPRNELSMLDMNVANRTVAHNNAIDGEYSHGQKRTASGDVKSGDAGSPTSPVDNSARRPTTRASISSNGSQIGELSAQLRTRLSYAMVKVQHGWETRTISEIESFTSQHPSPVSTTATTASRSLNSPLTTPITYPTDRLTFAQSSERSTATPETIHNTPHLQNGTATLDYAYPRSPSDPVYSPDHPTRTYEQFWREHPSASRHPHTLAGPSLAPPVDIQPRRAAHLAHNPYQSLSLHTNLTSPRTTSTIPSTPPHQQRRAPAIRTPSQKAKMEKDAVETLLFMSSPGNSVMRAGRTLGSPTGKKVGFTSHNTTNGAGDGFSSDEDEPTSAAGRRSGGVGLPPLPLPLPARLGLGLAVRGGGVRVGDEIDRLLDQMADAEAAGGGDSSSDEDVPIVTRGFVGTRAV